MYYLLRATWRQAKNLGKNNRGIIVVITALIFPVLLAFMGLALDVGVALNLKRRQQKAVDAAAFGAAHELFRGNSALFTDAAQDDAAINGFVHHERPGGDPDVTVTVNYPYTYNGSTNFVEVTIEKINIPTYFARIFGPETITVRSRAVAGGVRSYGDGCVLALNPTMKFALKISGQGNLVANCGIMVNSIDPRAIDLSTQACLFSQEWIGTSGEFDNGGSTCYSPQPTDHALPAYDPMAYMAQPPVPIPETPIAVNITVNEAFCEDETPSPAFTCNAGTYEWEPGLYEGRFKATKGNHVLKPGIFIINGGSMAFTTGGTITGTGVGIYGTAFGGKKWSGISVTAQGDLDLSAPTSGPMKGLIIWVDRTLAYTASGTVKFDGGGDFRWKGTIYAPSQHIDFGGNTNSGGDWVYLIGDNIDVHGQGAVTQLNGPTLDTVGAPDIFKPTLVE